MITSDDLDEIGSKRCSYCIRFVSLIFPGVKPVQNEYGVDTTLEPIPYTIARWVLEGWAAVDRAGRLFNTMAVRDG